jgi:hypothetical protein
MRIKSKYFWFEMGVALAMLCLFPFMVKAGGGPEQVAIPDIIINPPAPETHWLSTVSIIVGILAAGATTFVTLYRWLRGRKETNAIIDK